MCLWDHTDPTCWIGSLVLISRRHSSNYHECAKVSMEIFPCRRPNRADGLKLSTMWSFPDHERCLQTTAWSRLIVLPVWCLCSFWFKTLTVVLSTVIHAPLTAAYLCHLNADVRLLFFPTLDATLNCTMQGVVYTTLTIQSFFKSYDYFSFMEHKEGSLAKYCQLSPCNDKKNHKNTQYDLCMVFQDFWSHLTDWSRNWSSWSHYLLKVLLFVVTLKSHLQFWG